jgi:hypothetical protein
METLAADTPAWTGVIAGLVAVAAFVVFSGWILVQRLRRDRKDHHG